MKNNFISMLAVALGAAALFTSCEKEQSVFSPESLPGTCTITGVVKYNEGHALVGDQLVSDHEVPASGQVIMLSIPNSAYGNNSAGNQIYTDTLDAEGRYEFTIPAPANGESLYNATLEVIPFSASHAEYFEDAFQLVEHESVIYNTDNYAQINIRDQFPVEQNLTVGCTLPQNDVQYNVPLTINGSNVKGPGFENTTSTPQAAWVFISTDILIKVSLNSTYYGTTSTIYCTTQSDATTGEFTATVNLPEDFFTNYSATVEAKYVSCVKDFAFWYQDNRGEWNSTTLQLLYHSNPSLKNVPVDVNDEHEYIPLEYIADNHVETTVITSESDLILDNNQSAALFFGWNY